MSCEICGRNNCTASFHSLEEQSNFNDLADEIKDRAIRILNKRVDKLDGCYIGDDYYVKLKDVQDTISDYN